MNPFGAGCSMGIADGGGDVVVAAAMLVEHDQQHVRSHRHAGAQRIIHVGNQLLGIRNIVRWMRVVGDVSHEAIGKIVAPG